ncbi:hypothetical protein [Streptomyces bambusae]|uniref:Uncharacterized protein n=1 Tax=Streptomyces bambusae TaxID=1550616 RepID=A0ABS6Z7U1_9ACTN|nr:hypothetical protein [Streptomyces bambusae]MBW5483823.1 hypothetical protein [Streptomyces bambusae]
MICPHCEKNLLRKERTGNTCSHCHRRYALDPKTNPLALNDLRIRRVVHRITDEGRISVSTGQLWYALSRKRITEAEFGSGSLGVTCGVGLFVGFLGIVAELVPLLYVSGFLLVAVGGILAARWAGIGKGIPPVTHELFRKDALGEWQRVYGGLPPGVVDDTGDPWRATAQALASAPASAPATGRTAVLLCSDRSVATFLAANAVPFRHGIPLVRDPRDLRKLPAGLPVLVLHDADAEGELLVHRLRDELPGRRVVDAGLPLRTLRPLPGGVPYRDPARKPGAEEMRRLRELGTVTPEELDRLAKGWRFPLVAVPPSKLLDVVTRFAEEAGRKTDSERRRAAAVGFMTWPGTGTADGSAAAAGGGAR